MEREPEQRPYERWEEFILTLPFGSEPELDYEDGLQKVQDELTHMARPLLEARQRLVDAKSALEAWRLLVDVEDPHIRGLAGTRLSQLEAEATRAAMLLRRCEEGKDAGNGKARRAVLALRELAERSHRDPMVMVIE